MQLIDLKIEKPAYGGYGLGFHNGKACFVPYTVPGDEAVVEIYKDKKDYSYGRIVQHKSGTMQKMNPECPNFAVCGGCSYLNLSYEVELRLKNEILMDSLVRTARINSADLPAISVVYDTRFNYRTHASIKTKNGNTGFFMKESNDLVLFPEGGCLLLSDPLKQRIFSMRDRKLPEEFKIASSHNDEVCASTEKQKIIRELEENLIFERDISLFFQANRFLRSRMMEIVSNYAALSRDDTYLDIGCGIGFFTLYLASSAKYGYGIDINRKSIEWARHNADLNDIGNVSFEAKSASEAHSYGQPFGAVILDPPRAGLGKKAREALRALAPGRIVYVSCNPSTFARDTADLLKYGYSLKKLTMIDMFPATYHIEIIALFTSRK